MKHIVPLTPPPFRRRLICRRAVRTFCQAVRLDDFALLGERVLDLSSHGMLIAADRPAAVGEHVIVSFQDPSGRWYDAEATVARVLEGYREGDPGYAIGLRFGQFKLAERLELKASLLGIPPRVPMRRLRQPPPLAF